MHDILVSGMHSMPVVHGMNPALDPEPENRTHIFMVMPLFIQHPVSVCLSWTLIALQCSA